ncbi:hypothetical protein HRbin32_00897 [bacterium HR32]|jgi:hypothetical protein|nr:hypothetical protein HRbin32_00897 [bacterium HR32]
MGAWGVRPPWAVLVVLLASCARTPDLSVCLPPDGRFELRYVHSVERTPVVERYRVWDRSLWLEGMRFQSLGWGLPAEGFVRRGGWFETTGPPRRMDGLVLRVSHQVRPELAAGQQTLPLYRRVPDGAALRLEVSSGGGCPERLLLRPAP